MLKRICVYSGSSDKILADYLAAARRMGELIAREGLTIVYAAGSTGMMGALAQAGGEVWGVIPEMFNTPKLVHSNLTRLEVVETMHLRKARMAKLADAFVALPGGLGTFEELFEIITWTLDWALLVSFRERLRLIEAYNQLARRECAEGRTPLRYREVKVAIVAPKDIFPAARILDYDQYSQELIEQGYWAAQRAFRRYFGSV